MVACFQYSPINILSVRLSPAILEFCSPGEQSWIDEEASKLLQNAEAVYAEISDVLEEINRRSLSFTHEFSDANDLHGHVLELSDMLAKEEDYFKGLLRLPNRENQEQNQSAFDILEINRLRHSLLISSRVWNRQLYLLDSLLRKSSGPKALNDVEHPVGRETYPKDFTRNLGREEDSRPDHWSIDESPTLLYQMEKCKSGPSLQNDYILALKEWDDVVRHEGNVVNSTSLEHLPSAGSILSDQIDSAWCGAGQTSVGALLLDTPKGEVSNSISARQSDWKDNPSFRRLVSQTRVYSDSAQMIQQRMSPPSLLLPKFPSFHASGDYRYMLRDLVLQRSCSHASPHGDEKLNLTNGPSFVSFPSIVPEGARLMAPLNGKHDVVVTVYDNEPTSILSYALSSKEYADFISDKQNSDSLFSRANSTASDLLTWQSCGSLDLDYTHFSSYTSEDASSTPKSSPHARISFEDEYSTSGKTRFHITCYFAKQFIMLKRRCCPNDLDLVRSLSRCRRWSAQGGKSNVYFDERFIIKQVTKTELNSFQEFSSEYFKHVTDALISGSPTCLAKILGIYQVTVKPSKGGKETKMDLMVMENLFFKKSISKVYDLKGSAIFFKKSISKVYDLKGSARSRYNPDTTGANKVLLDANLLETLRTNPIFLGSKAKRKLERAVWNDTSFLASVDVMDYPLLVGVDEERKELVVGIIDYMRQYTWDKHLETRVKASGILGGPKNASPTIVSPKLYKKRFRKAITTYFLTLPDQWPT